jgi:hypothetical protein
MEDVWSTCGGQETERQEGVKGLNILFEDTVLMTYFLLLGPSAKCSITSNSVSGWGHGFNTWALGGGELKVQAKAIAILSS